MFEQILLIAIGTISMFYSIRVIHRRAGGTMSDRKLFLVAFIPLGWLWFVLFTKISTAKKSNILIVKH
jgi:hypothetical protein